MTSRFIVCMMIAMIGASFLSCSNEPLVVQGTVIRYDSAEKVIVIKDDQSPNQELTLRLSTADMGTEPKEGEIVRVAYHRTPQGLIGIRVMNLSHQIK